MATDDNGDVQAGRTTMTEAARLTAPPPEDGSVTFICAAPLSLVPVAEALAAVLEPGDAVLLHGPLGAGKTTLVQYLARALGVGEEQYVSSPSFALMHEYQGRLPVFHMDLYRLADADDVEAAGLLDFFAQQGVCLVEWPDRLGGQTPEARLDLAIEIMPSDAARRLTLTPHGAVWTRRIGALAARLAPKASS